MTLFRRSSAAIARPPAVWPVRVSARLIALIAAVFALIMLAAGPLAQAQAKPRAKPAAAAPKPPAKPAPKPVIYPGVPHIALSAVEQQKAKAQAKKMRQRGLEAPSDEQKLVAKAVGALLDSNSEHLGVAIHWIANLSEAPSDQYRRYARKMLELVETA